MTDLITHVPEGFLQEFEAEILGRIPEEKVQAELRQQKIARVMNAVGSVHIPEIGQKIAQIDARLYHRMRLSFADSPDDTDWLDAVLADNKSLRAPGYDAPQKSTRHGITFTNGKPIGAGPHSERYG
jgi:hypothetical protein